MLEFVLLRFTPSCVCERCRGHRSNVRFNWNVCVGQGSGQLCRRQANGVSSVVGLGRVTKQSSPLLQCFTIDELLRIAREYIDRQSSDRPTALEIRR